MAKNISFTLKYWRQNGPREKGHFDVREMHDIPDDTSFLEMLDILNEELINEGQEPRTSYRCYHLSALHAPFQRR